MKEYTSDILHTFNLMRNISLEFLINTGLLLLYELLITIFIVINNSYNNNTHKQQLC